MISSFPPQGSMPGGLEEIALLMTMQASEERTEQDAHSGPASGSSRTCLPDSGESMSVRSPSSCNSVSLGLSPPASIFIFEQALRDYKGKHGWVRELSCKSLPLCLAPRPSHSGLLPWPCSFCSLQVFPGSLISKITPKATICDSIASIPSLKVRAANCISMGK